MTTAINEFSAMHGELFGEFAEAGTVQRGAAAATAVRMLPDDGIVEVGEYGRTVGTKRVRAFLKSEWDPQRGDVVTVRGSSAKVADILSDDGYLVKVVLHG